MVVVGSAHDFYFDDSSSNPAGVNFDFFHVNVVLKHVTTIEEANIKN